MDREIMQSQASSKSQNQFQEARKLVENLFEPKAKIFWSDFLLSTFTGWSAFIVAYLVTPLSWQMFAAIAIAIVALYRSLVFIHELTHLRANALPGFAQVWDLFAGIPLLLPSFTYVGVHADHHGLTSYGTIRDPEYMPFAGKQIEIFFFIAHSLLLPAVLMLRFLVLSPVGLLLPPLHRFLESYASSLVMNLRYYRKVSDEDSRKMKVTEFLLLSCWAIPIVLSLYGFLSWRIFAIWYVVMACIMLMNSLRTLGAHRYRSTGNVMTLENQLLDSVDTPGNFWTIIWAPVGLRYHALHHYFPSMPYHNLPIAYQRLIRGLSPDSSYRLVISPSLWHSLKTLWGDRIGE
jgi:fatty acid desaturase